MDAHIEAAVQDYEGDCGMVAGDIDEQAEMDAYYTYLSQMEDERMGRVPEKPEHVRDERTLTEKLDALKPKEAAFRAEVRERRGRWGSTLELPQRKGEMRAFTNGVLASIHEWGRSHEEERIEELGWSEHPNEDRPVHPEPL